MAFPPSLNEQLVIVSKLDGLLTASGSLAQFYQTKLVRIAELKQSILQMAFVGALTSHAIKEAAE